MTIDATKPEDSVLNSELPAYIRANRAEMNSISVTGTGAVGAVTLDINGAVTLTIGTELSLEGFETIVLTNTGISVLATILGGLQGQIKVFVCRDTRTGFQDNNGRLNGTLDLNQWPINGIYTPIADGDVLMLVNVGGDGAGNHGYWRELDRASNA